jgi:serine/threonine protein kinase
MVAPSRSPQITSGIRESDVLDRKHRVERVIGRSGMGVVAVAHHLALDERVAIKFLLPDALEDSGPWRASSARPARR